MSYKLPQWTATHHPAVSAINDLRASCRSGIEQHAAYVGGAKLMMAVASHCSTRMFRMLDTLTSVCQCTSCVVRRLKKERGSPRHPSTKQKRFFEYPHPGWQEVAGRKLNPEHALGCLIRKPCEACNPLMCLDAATGRVDMVFNLADVLNSEAGVGQGYPVRASHFVGSCNDHPDCAAAEVHAGHTLKHCYKHDCEGC